MKIPDFANIIKKLTELVPEHNIERLIFKALLSIWIFVILVVIILRIVFGTREDIERKIIEAAANVKFPAKVKSEIGGYESLLNLEKHPEGIEEYTREIKRDPFLEYKKELAIQPLRPTEHDFILKSIAKTQLPLVYKGYIELPDRIIGQINWWDATRFVKTGSVLNGYKIQSISKEKIEAIDEKGKNVEFQLNKPVFGDGLRAVLYDNISKKTFNVEVATEIDDYKVIDITLDYVILLTKEKELKLAK